MYKRKPPSEPRAMRDKKPTKTVATPKQSTYVPGNDLVTGAGQAETATRNTELDKNVAWSNSRVWVSEEEKIRGRFLAMRTNAKHLGLEKSPFLPKTPGEYAAVLAEKKAEEAKKIANKAQMKEESTKVEPLLQGKKYGDGLSTVLAMNSAFNEIPAYDKNAVDKYWPPAWAYFQQKHP